MRSESEIKQLCKQQYNKELKSRYKKYLDKSYMNCKHNRRNKIKNHGSVGFCFCDQILDRIGTKHPVICSDDDSMKKCDCFECIHTQESVKQDFEDIVSDPAKCGKEYPKLAVLLWVIQGKHETTLRGWLSKLMRFGL